MKSFKVTIGVMCAYFGLLCMVEVDANPRQMRRMQQTIDHIFTEMGKFRRDLSFMQTRIDEIEDAVVNVTLAGGPSGNGQSPSDTGTSDFQPFANQKDLAGRAELDKVNLKMDMALKGLSKEKMHIRNMVQGLEKLVRDGAIGDDVEKRLFKIENKVDALTKPNVDVVGKDVKDVKLIPVSGDVKYSFSARLDKSRDIVPDPRAKRLGHKMHSKRLQFGDVLHNDGDVYNPVTGKFSCKKDGVYLFVFFVEGIFRRKYASSGQTSMVALSVDGKYQTLAASKAFSADGRNTGGNSVILKLVRGQQVWLETVAPISQMITLREWVSTFTGTMLY